MPADEACSHCGEAVHARIRKEHWPLTTGGGYGKPMFGHRGLCCDCFDLECGKPLEHINVDRVSKGKAPIPPLTPA